MFKVTILILNYNNKIILKKFLPILIIYSNNFPIIIIDNKSTDKSIQFLQKYYPKIINIKLNKNEGFSRGYNTILKKIKSKYYIIINSDIKVTYRWIEPIINFMDKNKKIAICQPKILSYNSPKKFEYSGAAGGLIDILGYPFCVGRIFNITEFDNKQYENVKKIFWASGTCFFIKSKIFFQINGFDENFFAHFEEIDLCSKINNYKLNVYYNNSSQIYHIGGTTLNKKNPLKTYLNFKNKMLLIYKNKNTFFSFKKKTIIFLLDFITILFFFSKKHKISIIKAHINFYKIKYVYKNYNNKIKRKNIILEFIKKIINISGSRI